MYIGGTLCTLCAMLKSCCSLVQIHMYVCLDGSDTKSGRGHEFKDVIWFPTWLSRMRVDDIFYCTPKFIRYHW